MRAWGQRLEDGPLGRALLTAVMAALMAAVLLWNLPPGAPHDAVRPVAGRLLLPLGLDQDWALFAPEPRGFSVGVYARVTRADGSTLVWVPPHNGVLLTPYRTYRWQKYVERLRGDDYSALWEPTARWVARHVGGPVRRVVLVRTFRDAVLPGATDPAGNAAARVPRSEHAFYTLTFP